MDYPHLFSEGRIGSLTVRNRTVMTPMGTGMANYDGTPSGQMVAYFEERAKHGVGLIVTGITRVNYLTGAVMPRQLSMANDRHIAPFGEMVDRVHAHGAKLFPQLHHPGRQNLSLMMSGGPAIELAGRLWPGFYRLLPPVLAFTGKFPALGDMMIEKLRWPAVTAPSKVVSVPFNQRTRALRKCEIRRLEQDFIRAAKRVRLSGADGVQLHGAHGYLIQQFLSPYTNRRTDEYGGSLENRMRFLLNIISGIRRECGDFPLTVRLSVDEHYRLFGRPGRGLELEEGVEIARRLEKAGIDAIDVTSGTYETMNGWLEPMRYEEGWRKYLARAVKEAVSIPVIAADVIRAPAGAEALLAEGIQDFVGLGRALLADAEWVSKARDGREDEIRRCISCLRCIESMFSEATRGVSFDCAVNPRMGRERETAAPGKDGKGRTVVVVGAGPAGMSAAEVLGRRGFRTVVFERAGEPGGQLNLAKVPPGKSKMQWCIDDLRKAAERAGVEFRFDTEASASAIEALDPCAVIVATGATPVVPRLPGIDRENVCTANEVLEGKVKLEGKRVAVIGSGLTGLETAEKLAEDGNSIVVVEIMKEPGPGIYFQNLDDVLQRLEPHEPEFITCHKLVEVGGGEVVLEDVNTRERTVREVDQVVLAVGVRSEDRLALELKRKAIRVLTVGDACSPGRIHGAVRGGFDAAREL